MTTWHRIDDHGIPVQFTAIPDDRGNVQLTTQELEGLMRTGGWEPGPITPHPQTLEERAAALNRAVTPTTSLASFAHALTRR